MKNQIQKTAASVIAFLLLTITTWAQDGKLLDIDIDVNKNEWYENPYIWIGVGVFIILAILAMRAGKK